MKQTFVPIAIGIIALLAGFFLQNFFPDEEPVLEPTPVNIADYFFLAQQIKSKTAQKEATATFNQFGAQLDAGQLTPEAYISSLRQAFKQRADNLNRIQEEEMKIAKYYADFPDYNAVGKRKPPFPRPPVPCDECPTCNGCLIFSLGEISAIQIPNKGINQKLTIMQGNELIITTEDTFSKLESGNLGGALNVLSPNATGPALMTLTVEGLDGAPSTLFQADVILR